MRFLDFLLGSKARTIHEPDQLRDALFEAAASGNRRSVLGLCRANRGAITQHFPTWQKVPEDIQADPARVQTYVGGLIAVADTFARGLGDQSLLQALVGTESSNPLTRWETTIRQAQELMERLEYREAALTLSDLLIDMRDLRGTGVDRYLPITYGSLGTSLFQSGEPDRSVGPLEKALGLCKQQRDTEGIVAYLRILYEVHRYRGQADAAADRAEELSQVFDDLGRSDEAAVFRKQARLARAREPLNRVVAIIGGQRYELDEMPGVIEGRVRFEFERNRNSLRPAQVLVERGEAHGSAGRT